MADGDRIYMCIDLKCFYASVECADRHLDPFKTNLVVADPTRGNTTICLAITPAMKALGVRNRCRIFEIPDGIVYQKAMPRMRRYMEVSAQIYQIYLSFFAKEDIHVYSIDECFIDATPYLAYYGCTPRELARRVIGVVTQKTQITATAGIGTNLFLAKVALDITAKHDPGNIGWLDSEEFKRRIWKHRPITDVWGIGPGIARRLESYGVHDLMGLALMDEDQLYAEFGVRAELLRDHAWGEEPCTIADIQAFRPQGHSISNGQVLPRDYCFDEALVVLREMVDGLVLELVEQGLACGHISLMVGYANERGPLAAAGVPAGGALGGGAEAGQAGVFVGEHGTRSLVHRYGGDAASRKLCGHTDSRAKLTQEFLALFRQTVDRTHAVRRINIGMGALLPVELAELSLFDDQQANEAERRLAKATLAVKARFGKNALIRGTSLQEEATGRERNRQVGGHHE